MKAMIDYENFPPENRLSDVSQTAKGWTFETLEHDEANFPVVIRATDAEGRSCNYIAFGPEGAAINIKAVEFDPPPQSRSTKARSDATSSTW
jgi:hypothetical protein